MFFYLRRDSINTEIEVRILDINEKELINKLESLNASFIGDWNQKRYIYDFNPVDENKWIRLRTTGEETTLTIKKYESATIDGTKELEILVDDIEKTNLILEELGYKKRSVQENKRIRYMLNDVEIDIDTWPHLNTYVEFEGKSEEEVKKVISLLEYNYEDATARNVNDIYKEKGFTKEQINNLQFERNE